MGLGGREGILEQASNDAELGAVDVVEKGEGIAAEGTGRVGGAEGGEALVENGVRVGPRRLRSRTLEYGRRNLRPNRGLRYECAKSGEKGRAESVHQHGHDLFEPICFPKWTELVNANQRSGRGRRPANASRQRVRAQLLLARRAHRDSQE